MNILLDKTTDESSVKKILFPTLQQIVDLKIQFNEKFDTLLLFDYQLGTIDLNSYFSKISFIKNNNLFVFTEYENPEYGNYNTILYQSTDLENCTDKDIQDFFIESNYYFYQLKYPETFSKKRIKI